MQTRGINGYATKFIQVGRSIVSRQDLITYDYWPKRKIFPSKNITWINNLEKGIKHCEVFAILD